MLLAASGCAAEPEKSTGMFPADPNSALGLPALIGLEPIVQPETQVLGDEELQELDTVELLNPETCLLVPQQDLCEYRLTFATLPDGVEAGSVLVAGVSAVTPDGILVVVDSVDGNEVLATQGTLGDALEQGEFLVEKSFTTDDLESEVLGEGVTRSPEVAAVGGGLHQPTASREDAGIKFAYDVDKEITAGVRATGHVSFEIGCGVYGGLTWETVWDVPVYPNGVYFDARCGASQEGAIAITGSAGVEVSKEYEITTQDMEPITFFVGPVPIVLIPRVIITANANGTIAAEMSLGASEKFAAIAGISYNDGFTTVKDFDYDFSHSASTGSARLSLKAGISVKESLMLYGIVGPQLTETLYLDLQGKPMGERPIWCLRGGLSAGVSLSIDLGVKNLEWGPGELFDESEELGCAENTAPTVTVVSPQDGSVLYPGTAMSGLTFYGQAYDQEDGGLLLNWSSDLDGDLGSTKQGKQLVLEDLSFGTHTITVTATDSDGLTTTRSFSITTKDALPTVVFQQKDANGVWKPITGITGQKGDTAYFRLSASSVDTFASANCGSVSWATTMTVTNTNNCDFAVVLSQQGSSTLTANLADTNGKTGSASIALTVTAPPAVVAPQFSLVTTKTTSNPIRTIPDGGYIDWGEQATLKIDYTNSASANKKVRYDWSMRSTSSGNAPGPWTAMGSQDAATLAGSTRSYTAPTVFAKTYLLEFKVVVTDAGTGAALTTRTFQMSYSGPPA